MSTTKTVVKTRPTKIAMKLSAMKAVMKMITEKNGEDDEKITEDDYKTKSGLMLIKMKMRTTKTMVKMRITRDDVE